jgi:DNA invertase Pin-like site-specific DNA recombinase
MQRYKILLTSYGGLTMSVRSIVRKPNQHQNVWMEQFPKDKDGVIYVRQSSMAQVEQNIHSFEAQTEKFIDYFRNMGCTGQITIIPDDEGVSGTVDIHKRVGMSKLMKLIEQEQVGWIAAVHVNRFTRDKYGIDPGILIQACEKHNVWVATLRMNFNFRDDYSQRVFKIEAEEAARHLEWMKLILGGGKRAASDRGYYDGRTLAPGYIVDRSDEKRKKLTPYLPHVIGTQWVFQRFFELDGEFWRLRREVHEKDYLYPPFEAWVEKENVKKFAVKQITEGPFAGYYKPTETGLRYMLTNPVYIGWWIPLDGGVVYNNHEPLVSDRHDSDGKRHV